MVARYKLHLFRQVDVFMDYKFPTLLLLLLRHVHNCQLAMSIEPIRCCRSTMAHFLRSCQSKPPPWHQCPPNVTPYLCPSFLAHWMLFDLLRPSQSALTKHLVVADVHSMLPWAPSENLIKLERNTPKNKKERNCKPTNGWHLDNHTYDPTLERYLDPYCLPNMVVDTTVYAFSKLS